MPIQLPDLFDKKFEDIFNTMIQSIPKHTKKWTNYNSSDPGITILEMLAWFGETTLYKIDAIPLKLYQNFLKLVAGASGEEINELLFQVGIDEAYRKILQFQGDVECRFHPGSFKKGGLKNLITKFWKNQKPYKEIYTKKGDKVKDVIVKKLNFKKTVTLYDSAEKIILGIQKDTEEYSKTEIKAEIGFEKDLEAQKIIDILKEDIEKFEALRKSLSNNLIWSIEKITEGKSEERKSEKKEERKLEKKEERKSEKKEERKLEKKEEKIIKVEYYKNIISIEKMKTEEEETIWIIYSWKNETSNGWNKKIDKNFIDQMMESFDSKIQKWLNRFDPSYYLSLKFQKLFLYELNILIQSGSLYQKQYFPNIDGNGTAIHDLLKKEMKLDDINHLNRYLLEITFPEEIKKWSSKNASEIRKNVIDFFYTPYRAVTKENFKMLLRNITYYDEEGKKQRLDLKKIIIETSQVNHNLQEHEVRLVIIPEMGNSYNFISKEKIIKLKENRKITSPNFKEKIIKTLKLEKKIVDSIFKYFSIKEGMQIDSEKVNYIIDYMVTKSIDEKLRTIVKNYLEPRRIIGTSLLVKNCEEIFISLQMEIICENSTKNDSVKRIIKKKIIKYFDPIYGRVNGDGHYNRKFNEDEFKNYLSKNIKEIKRFENITIEETKKQETKKQETKKQETLSIMILLDINIIISKKS